MKVTGSDQGDHAATRPDTAEELLGAGCAGGRVGLLCACVVWGVVSAAVSFDPDVRRLCTLDVGLCFLGGGVAVRGF